MSADKFVPDSACKQGKCARQTTGCWGKCCLTEQNYVVSNPSVVVQGDALGQQAGELPPLPRAAMLVGINLESLSLRYTKDQMHAYARAALAQRPTSAAPNVDHLNKSDSKEAAELMTLLVDKFSQYRKPYPVGLFGWARAALESMPTSAAPEDADVAQIVAEVNEACAKWPPFNSAHEGFAVLKEEVDELWDHVKVNQKRRNLEEMRKEAKQVAAMALRFMRECCDEITGRK